MGNLEQAMKDECLKNVDSKEAWKYALDIEGEDKGMNLEKLYKMQEELDKYIIKNRNIVMSDEELLDKTILALLVEVGELANATRCFKHWSTKGPESKERLLDELADIWHFYLSIGNQLGYKWDYGKETDYNPLWNGEISSSLTFIFHITYIETSQIANDPHNHEGRNKYSYKKIGINLVRLAKVLGFTDEEVEQAYLKKHEENYRRQREGYEWINVKIVAIMIMRTPTEEADIVTYLIVM